MIGSGLISLSLIEDISAWFAFLISTDFFTEIFLAETQLLQIYVCIIIDRQVKFLLKMRTFHNNHFITRIIDLAYNYS